MPLCIRQNNQARAAVVRSGAVTGYDGGQSSGGWQRGRFRGPGQYNMSIQGVVEKARKFTEPVITGLGYELVDLKFVNEDGRWRLRFYIDKPDGIGIGDCETVSREIEPVLEVEDVVSGAYALEVSSPGLDRPLHKPSDYIRFEGTLAKVKTKEPVGGQKVFVGRIISPGESGFDMLAEDGKTITHIEYDQVQKANLEVEF